MHLEIVKFSSNKQTKKHFTVQDASLGQMYCGRMGGTLDSCPRAGCLKLLSCTNREEGADYKWASRDQHDHYPLITNGRTGNNKLSYS